MARYGKAVVVRQSSVVCGMVRCGRAVKVRNQQSLTRLVKIFLGDGRWVKRQQN